MLQTCMHGLLRRRKCVHLSERQQMQHVCVLALSKKKPRSCPHTVMRACAGKNVRAMVSRRFRYSCQAWAAMTR